MAKNEDIDGMADGLKESAAYSGDLSENLQKVLKLMHGIRKKGDSFVDVTKKISENMASFSKIAINRKKIETDIGNELGRNKKLQDDIKSKLDIETSTNAAGWEMRVAYMKLERDELNKQKSALEKNQDLIRKGIPIWVNVSTAMSHVKDKLMGMSEDTSKIVNLFKSFTKGPLNAFIAMLDAAIDRWIEIDKGAAQFRRTTGFLVTQMGGIRTAVESANVELVKFGVSLEFGYKIAADFAESLGVASLITSDMVKDTALLSTNLGIGSKDVAEFTSKFASIAKSSGMTVTSIVKSTAALSEMAGVAPAKVMQDMANASENTMIFLSKSPMLLMRSAVEARRLGTTIDKLADAGKGMLNYQSSMTDELEASALLNRNVSFQLSRQLAWEGKLVESREAALRQMGSLEEFTRLTVYQQGALAKAGGMTVVEVTKQLNQQKLLAIARERINKNGSSADKERLAAYEAYKKSVEKGDDNSQAALEKRADAMMNEMLMQGEMEKFSNSIKSMWIEIQSALLPIANAIMPVIIFGVRIISEGFKLISSIVRGMLSPLGDIAKRFLQGEEGAKKLEDIITSISDGISSISPLVESVGNVFGKLIIPMSAILTIYNLIIAGASNSTRWVGMLSDGFKDLSVTVSKFGKGLSGISKIFKPFVSIASGALKFLGTISRFLGPIGLVISAVMFVIDLFGQLIDIWSSDDMNIGDKIINSVYAIPNALFNVIVSPFVDLVAWVLKIFKYDIPDGMIDGMKSAGKEFLHWLVNPFGKAIEWLYDHGWLARSPSKIGLAIVAGIKAVGSMVFDFLVSPFKRAWTFIKNLPFIKNLFGGAKDAVASIDTSVESTVNSNISSIVEIKNLDSLKEVVSELTEAVLKLGNISAEKTAVITSQPTSNDDRAIVSKLDELISLMKAGGIAVNLDGYKISNRLAANYGT
jgi:hypothetical protein